MIDLTRLPIWVGTPEEAEEFNRHVRRQVIEKGRSARRAGVPRNSTLGQFRDNDMSLDWQNGWRWEDEEIMARKKKRQEEEAMTKHDKRDRTGVFSGPVLDGHFAGDWVSRDVTEFCLQWTESRWPTGPWSPDAPRLMDQAAMLRTVRYRFMPSYGAWAKIQEW